MRVTLSAVHLVVFVATVFVLNVGVLAWFISRPRSFAEQTDERNSGRQPAQPARALPLAAQDATGSLSPPGSDAALRPAEVVVAPNPASSQSEAEPKDFSASWCVHLWKSPEAYFCAHPGSPAVWTERSASEPSAIKFTFGQLYYTPAHKEAGLYDADRGMVVVLLRTAAMLGDGAKDEAQARAMAQDLDKLSDALVSKLPARTRHPDPAHTASILVMISSYRDVLCANTLQELFEHAVNPNRVTVGIVLQADPDDANCLEDFCAAVGEAKCRRAQIRQLRRTLEYSRGVMPARYLQQTLIKDEEFCFQIDSHMVFPPQWDAVAVDDWLSARNEMAVMTTYPNRAADRTNQEFSPARCNTVWGHNVVACGTSAHNIRHGKDPILVAFFGAGIAFNKCHANFAVPIDPYMSFLFKGEEFDRSARLWTAGYDLYAPRKNYAYHFYDDDPKPKGHEKDKPRDRSFLSGSKDANELLFQAELRWMTVMGMLDEAVEAKSGAAAAAAAAAAAGEEDRAERLRRAHAAAGGKRQQLLLREAMAQQISLYGLGRRRSIRAYQIYSGVNLKRHTNKDVCDRLGKMEWVPWDREPEFEPLGKGCGLASDSQVCCRHALAQSAKLVDEHLRLKNAEWAARVRDSPVVQNPRPGPVISRGWDDAVIVNC